MSVVEAILNTRATREPRNAYHYDPSTAAGIAFVVVFALSTLAHSFQAARYRSFYLYPTVVLAGVLEVLGWSGRLWSSYSPLSNIPFQIQICCTIIAPTPLVAANFIVLGRIISNLGPQYSRLPPRLYSIIFLSADFLSLVVQAVGGGVAATANDLQNANRGGNVMLGGIAFQFAMMVIFCICAAEFFIRYLKDAPISRSNQSSFGNVRGQLDGKLKAVVCGLIFATLTLLIRGLYRTVELADGWTGKIITTQWLFIVFDGVMIVLAMYTFNFIHPGRLLAGKEPLVTTKDMETGHTSSGSEREPKN